MPVAVRRRPARLRALLLRILLALLLAGPVPAGLTTAASAAGPDCPALVLSALDETRLPGVEVTAALPGATGGADPQFTVRAAGRELPVAVQRPTAGDLAVAVVLTGDPAAGPASSTPALLAARELLATLPEGTRVAVVDGLGPVRLAAPLSPDRDAAGTALARLSARSAVAAEPAAAVDLGLQQVTGQPFPDVVVVQPAAGAVPRRASTTGAAVSGLVYGPPDLARTCASGVVGEVDRTVAALTHQYRLSFSTPDPGATVVSVSTPARAGSAGLLGGPVAPAGPTGPARRGWPLPVLLAAYLLAGLLVVVSLLPRRRTKGHDGQEDGGQVTPAGAPGRTRSPGP